MRGCSLVDASEDRMGANGTGRVRFGNFELDPHAERLFCDGQRVKIQPQPLRVLGVLVERPGEIVFREDLRARIWGQDTYVEFDKSLNYCIRQIRAALRDNASQPVYIETLPKQGYRFIAAIVITRIGAGEAIADSPPLRTLLKPLLALSAVLALAAVAGIWWRTAGGR